MEFNVEVLPSLFSDRIAAFLEAALAPSKIAAQAHPAVQIAEHYCKFLKVKLGKIDPWHRRIENDLPRESIKLLNSAEWDLLIVQVETVEAQRPTRQAVRRLQESQRRCYCVEVVLAELDV